MPTHLHTEPCVGCGSHFPPSDGPIHRYMTSSPGCWEAFGEILQRFYRDDAAADAHRISVDTYAVQHPGTPSPQAIQSVTGHLINLCLMFEYKVSDPEWRRGIIKTVTRYSDQFVWLEPPMQNGTITVADMLPLTDILALQQQSIKWASSIWDAWHLHHPLIRQWAAKIL
jgi:hypothetical protein